MATEEQQLAKRLKANHPIYDQLAYMWVEIRDVVYGGVQERKELYLPRGDAEDGENWALRLAFARFKADTPGILQRIVAAIFSEAPNRPEELVNSNRDLIENADGCDTHINDFLEDRMFSALAFGASFVLVDRPQIDNGQVIETTSKNFETVEVERSVSDSDIRFIPYDIDQITNWSVDVCGEFNWLRTREVGVRQLTPEEKPEEVVTFTEWDRTAWRRFEVRKSKIGGEEEAVQVDEGEHNLGIVPFGVLWINKESEMKFISFMRFAYHYDIHNFQDDADMRYDTFMHAHPTLKRKADREAGNEIFVGANSVVDLDPNQEEDVEYLRYPTEATEQLRRNIESNLANMRRVSGLDPLGTLETNQSFRASGSARRTSFNVTEARHLNRYSRRLQAFEARLWEIVERWKDPDPDRATTEKMNEFMTSYPRVFTAVAPDQLIESWQETRNQINSETYDMLMQRKIVLNMLPDLSTKELERVLKDIRKNPLIGKVSPMEPESDPLNSAQDAENAIQQFQSLTRADVQERSSAQNGSTS